MSSPNQAAVSAPISPYIDNLFVHVKDYYNEASAFQTAMEKNVLKFCLPLSRPAAIIIYRLWKAVPYTAAEIFLPSSLYIMGVIGVIAYKVITTPQGSRPNLNFVLNGVGFSQIILGGYSFLVGCSLNSTISVISGIFWITVGGACLYSSGIASIFTPSAPVEDQ